MRTKEMMAYEKHLREFGLLDKLANKGTNTNAFQINMAKRLREIAMDALRNNPNHNPNLKHAQDALNSKDYAVDDIGPKGEIRVAAANSPYRSLESYLQEQKREGAEARDLSLAALAEALEINIILCDLDPKGKVTRSQLLNISEDYNPGKPTICVTGGYGHWDAVVDCTFNSYGTVLSGRKVDAIGDGNCGYNAVALSLAALEQKRNAMRLDGTELWGGRKRKWEEDPVVKVIAEAIKETSPEIDPAELKSKIIEIQKKFLNGTKESENLESTEAREVSPEVKKQIEDDEALAWKIAAQDMIDEEDEISHKGGPSNRS